MTWKLLFWNWLLQARVRNWENEWLKETLKWSSALKSRCSWKWLKTRRMKECFVFCWYSIVTVYILVPVVRHWRDVKFFGPVKRRSESRFPLKNPEILGRTHRHFPCYDEDRIENDASNICSVVAYALVASVIFLSSCYFYFFKIGKVGQNKRRTWDACLSLNYLN
jgi:hypothetical protein